MNELIALAAHELGGETVPTVNARDLHAFLESGQEFRHWIKARIDQYSFVENQDFVTSENFIRGGKATDYHVTLDREGQAGKAIFHRVRAALAAAAKASVPLALSQSVD